MKFISGFLITSLIAFGLLYGLVVAVDPYNKLGNNLFGFETKAVDFARVNKFNQVEYGQKPYEAFIMGSSAAHRYPTKEVERLTGLVTYNYSTQSASPEDYLAMTRHVLSKYKPKLIILSVDFENLNAEVKTDEMFYASPLKNYLNEMPADEGEQGFFNLSYLTLEALGDSFKVIWVNLFGKATHSYLEDGNYKAEPIPQKIVIDQFSGKPYNISEKRVQYLRIMKEICDKNNIELKVLTAPLSKEHLELFDKDPELVKYQELFKSTLVGIFGVVYDFENHTMDAFNEPKWWQNSNHASPALSTIILERVFGKRDSPGVILKK